MSGAEISSDTASQSTWGLALRWLDKCTKSHPKCLQNRDARWHPTRLVEVGLDDLSKVKLHVCEQSCFRQPYVTLSHCWGLHKIMTLTVNNLDSMCEEIHLSQLPKTFQEAIAITRRLGISFIWIDSLCIIQDSQEDWQLEAASMHDVYKNSYVNIAATGASNDSLGCFAERNALLVQPCKVDAKWDWGPGNYYLYDSTFWRHGVTRAPLNTRAWVVQERILAPRVLHFGSHQIYWECDEINACETFPSGIPVDLNYEEPRFKGQSPAVDGTRLRCFSAEWYGLLRADAALNAYDIWCNLLQTYTRSNLTKGEDKLVAISGVAKNMRQLLNDEYLAGLWRRHLPYHLLWFKERASPTSFRLSNANYRAPSWSWASLDGEITTHPISHINGEQILIKLLDVHITAVGPDVTGQVSGARLFLRGLLKPASWKWLDDDQLYTLILDGQNANDSYAFPDEESVLASADVFCLPVHTFDLGVDERRTYGLVLGSTGSGMNEFRRLGQFKVEFDDCKAFDCNMLEERDIVLV